MENILSDDVISFLILEEIVCLDISGSSVRTGYPIRCPPRLLRENDPVGLPRIDLAT